MWVLIFLCSVVFVCFCVFCVVFFYPYSFVHLIFEHDIARAHRARDVQDHLHFRRLTTLPWLERSPDLSPVERLWSILGRRVQRRPHKPQDINELADAVQKEWRRILQAITGRVIKSMRRRCLACLAANEGPTRY